MWPDLNLPEITIQVPCRVGRRGKSTVHDVTIDSSWSATTPHALELERLAAGLAEPISCLVLVDRILPAIAQMWSYRLRSVTNLVHKDIQNNDRRQIECHGCDTLPRVAKRHQHLREVNHWLAVSEADRALFIQTEKGIESEFRKKVPGGEFWNWSDKGSDLIREPNYRKDELASAGFMPSDREFWAAGIHPDFICEVHQKVADPGEFLPLSFYLDVVQRKVDLDWLVDAFRRYGAGVGVWAASDYGEVDRRDPQARWRWYESGIHTRAVRVLMRHPYSWNDVDRLAKAIGESKPLAALILTDWLNNGWKPKIADLVEAYSSNSWINRVPSEASVKRLPIEDMTLAALMLTAIGTPAETIRAWNGGVRDLAGAVRWRQEHN